MRSYEFPEPRSRAGPGAAMGSATGHLPAGRLRRLPDRVAKPQAAVDSVTTVVFPPAVELVHPVAAEHHRVLACPVEPQPELLPGLCADHYLAEFVCPIQWPRLAVVFGRPQPVEDDRDVLGRDDELIDRGRVPERLPLTQAGLHLGYLAVLRQDERRRIIPLLESVGTSDRYRQDRDGHRTYCQDQPASSPQIAPPTPNQ